MRKSSRKKYQKRQKVLMLTSVASMIDQFNLPNIDLLQEMGYEVHVACNFKEGNTCSTKRLRKLRTLLQRLHIVLHQWDCPRSIYPLASCIRAYRQLMDLLGRYQYEWMHCHSPIGGVLARIAAHQKNLRVIYTAHGFHFYKGAPLRNWIFYYPLEKLLAYWTDVLITVNREDYCFARKRLKAGKICYIPGVGVSQKFFETDRQKDSEAVDGKGLRKKYGIPDQAFLILSVGELSRRKNHQIVLDALAGLTRQDVYYIICGQGSQKRFLMKYAKKRGVLKQLRLVGYQEDLTRIYQNADLFVFPSKQEGMPVALMEAMASGLACVVSDIRGNRELIGGSRTCMGNMQLVAKAGGICFPLKQPERLQAAVKLLLKEKCLRQACGIRNQKEMEMRALPMVKDRMRKIYMDFIMADDVGFGKYGIREVNL